MKKSILLFILLTIISSSVLGQATDTKTIHSVDTWEVGLKAVTKGNMYVGLYASEKFRGLIEFIRHPDIPRDAKITKAYLYLNVYKASTQDHDLVAVDFPYYSGMSESSVISYFDNLKYSSPDVITAHWTAGESTGTKVLDLKNAIPRINTKFNNDGSFFVGLWEYDDDASYCGIDGWGHADEPLLWVEYETNSPPSKPTNGRPTGTYEEYKSIRNISFRWDGTTSNYLFYLKKNGSWIINGDEVSGERFNVDDVEDGTYYWGVKALKDGVPSEMASWELVLKHGNTRPDVPKNLRPVNNTEISGTSKVNFSWECSDDNLSEGDELTFRVVSGNSSSSVNNAEPPTKEFNYSIDNVSPGVYYWKVIAEDKDGLTSESTPIKLTVEVTPATLSSITITGPNSVDENSSATYICTATYSDGSTKTVTNDASWSRSCSSYADISGSGVLSTRSVSSNKDCTITATYGGKSGTHSVTIKNVATTPTISSIKITGPNSVNENSTATYTCTATYSNGSTKIITSDASWSRSCSSYADISGSGVLSTRSVSSNKDCTITATYDGKSDTHSVTIKNVATTPTNTRPNKPVLTNPSNGSTVSLPFNLTWNATDDDNDNLTYAVYGRKSGSDTWNVWGSPSSASFSISSLNPDTYLWIVKSYDGKLWSEFSDSRSFVISDGSTNHPPNKPVLTNPEEGAVFEVGNEHTFTWTCSDDDGDALSYEFVLGESPGSYTYSWSKDQNALTLWMDEGDYGKKYYWAVKAFDGKVWGALSNPRSFTVKESVSANKPPNKPTLISPSDGSVFKVGTEIIYKAYGTDDDGGPLKYQFYEKVGSNAWYLWEERSVSNSTDFTWESPFTVQWKVRTVDSDGAVSPFSDAWSYSIVDEGGTHPPNKPVITSPAYNEVLPLRLSTSGNKIFTIEWTCSDPDGDELIYLVSTSVSQDGLANAYRFEMTGNIINIYFSNPDYDYKGVRYARVLATDGIDTVASNVVQFYLDWPTSAEEIKLAEQITVYPNPTNQLLNIEFTTEPGKYSYELYNNMGQFILRKETDNRLETIDLTKTVSGIYILKIHNNSFSKTEKIIVK